MAASASILRRRLPFELVERSGLGNTRIEMENRERL
jgi:hypothetical protein